LVNWDAVGALGEVLGAIIVLATLFYLSRQIRHNADALDQANRYARASSVHESNSLFVQIFSQLGQNAELAAIYRRALAGELLDDDESVRFAAFVNTYFAWLEATYAQVAEELSVLNVLKESRSDLEFALETSQPYMKRLLQTEAGREWWLTDAPHLYSPAFIAAVDECVLETTKVEPAANRK
jgi:hypothetical protein